MSCFKFFFFFSFTLHLLTPFTFQSSLPFKKFVCHFSFVDTCWVDPLASPFFALAHFRVLCSSSNVFPSYLFPSLIHDTHILSLAHVVPLTFDHSIFQLAFVGLVVQPCKCLAWAFFACLMGSPSHMIFVGLSMTIGSWASHLVPIFSSCHFYKRFWMMMFVMLMCS